MDTDRTPSTQGDDYAQRLVTKETAVWKRVLDVQAPYRWNLRRQRLGRTLDVGCGIGRNLSVLAAGSVGVDHNAASVAIARSRGHNALTVDEFLMGNQAQPNSFDSLLLAHVIEHLEPSLSVEVLEGYLPYVRPLGKVFFICPQERGYASDATHVQFTDGQALQRLSTTVGLAPGIPFSFPFPRVAGKFFTYNEFCLLAHKPA